MDPTTTIVRGSARIALPHFQFGDDRDWNRKPDFEEEFPCNMETREIPIKNECEEFTVKQRRLHASSIPILTELFKMHLIRLADEWQEI